MNSLRVRLLVAAGAALLLFVLITAIALDRADAERAEQAVQHRLQGLVHSLLSAVEVSDKGDIEINEAALTDPRFFQFDSGLGALITETDGSIVWRSTSILRDPQIPLALPVGALSLTPPTEDLPVFSLAFGVSWGMDGDDRRFTVIVAEDSSSFVAQRTSFRRTLWAWLAVSAGLLLVVLLGILFWGLAPLRQLTQEVGNLQSGVQDSISKQYPEELQPLAQSLNTLIGNERLRQSRYRLALDDLAHSLKTPLAVLHTEVGNDPACKAPLQQMQQQIDYHLKRAMAGSGQSFGKHTACTPLIRQICAALSKVYADKSIAFDIDLQQQNELPAEKGDLMEVFGNLLDNASKWCKRKVAISASVSGHDTLFSIEDDGPGFPDNAEQLLSRGIRADQQKEGQGIGLALVADIMNSLNGDIHLAQSTRLGGAKVTLRFTTT